MTSLSRLFLLFLALGAAFRGSAQADTSMYLANASALDQLLPAPKYNTFYPDAAKEDTSLAVRRDRFRYLTIKVTPGEKGIAFAYLFKWDRNGLLEEYAEQAGENAQVPVDKRTFVYANKSLVKATHAAGGKSDTVWFSWTRSGRPATSCMREADSLVCDNRLYDGRNRLVVVENAKYGTHRGIFTYTYDGKGRLQTRSFNDSRWGYLICTDSLAYTFADASNTLTSVKHWLRVAGTGKVTLIDEKVMRADGKTVRYEYHHIAPAYGKLKPGAYLDVTYDTIGRRRTETYGYAETGANVQLDYRYSETADSVLTYHFTGAKKKVKKELSALDIKNYSYIANDDLPGDRMVASKLGYVYMPVKKGKRAMQLAYRYDYEWK